MPLDSYQKKILKDTRADQYTSSLKFTLITGAGFSALDAYRKQAYNEVDTYFSGAVLFNPFSEKRDSAGGFYKTSELMIVASRDYITTAQNKDTKLNYAGIKFRVSRVIDCTDTDEIVIYASRLE